MKKIYTVIAAAMIASASSAQMARKTQAEGPFAKFTLNGKVSMKKPNGRLMDFASSEKANAGRTAFKANKALADLKLIEDQPEGTLHDKWYGESEGYLVFWGSVYSSAFDGDITRFVTNDKGEVFLQNAMSTLITDTWIKGEKAVGDTVQFSFPQKYYEAPETDDEGNETGTVSGYYLYRMAYDEEQNLLKVDEASQTIKYVMRNDSLIRVDNLGDGVYLGVVNDGGYWVGYADYYQAWSRIDGEMSVPPASAERQRYQIDYLNEEEIESSGLVNVAFDGDDIYLGGLTDTAPDNWAKGKISGGKAVFQSKTYMGTDETNNVHTFFAGIGTESVWDSEYEEYMDSSYFEKEYVFDYDAAAKTLKAEGTFGVNIGRNSVETLAKYMRPSLKPWAEVAAAPRDPEVLDFFAYDAEYGYGGMQMWLENTSEDGVLFDTGKLYYNIYFDGKLYTFKPELYSGLDEEMTDVPYNFADKYDFVASGCTHTVYFYDPQEKTVGVQLLYKDGDNVYKSNLVTYVIGADGTLGVDKASLGNGNVEGKKVYTDICGRRVDSPSRGIFLETTKFADGSQRTVKVVR